jgi:8-oxo-dGTP diphosphatase
MDRSETENHPTMVKPTMVKVTAAIIARDGAVLIAQRHLADRMAGLWEFPGGKIEDGETPEQCLKRELYEELAMDATIGPFLGASIYQDAHISIELMAYRAYWNGSPFTLLTHNACQWVVPSRLNAFAFTPADRPFVRRLENGDIPIS